MIGTHDLGGVWGHGPVLAEANEPVFHEPWEARVFAINVLGGRWTSPEFRSVIEGMPPVEYLATSYYEHWLYQLEVFFVRLGVFSSEELEHRRATPNAAGEPSPGRSAVRVEQVMPMLLKGEPNRAPAVDPPRFSTGQRVVMTRDNPPTHTRVPAYVRGCAGRIIACHGAFAFADAQAQGHHGIAEHLYTVRFEAADLWGRTAGGHDAVYLDMHESYMKPLV